MNLNQTRYEIDKGVAVVILFRLDKMNALTPTMRKELITLFKEADLDDSVRVVNCSSASKYWLCGHSRRVSFHSRSI